MRPEKREATSQEKTELPSGSRRGFQCEGLEMGTHGSEAMMETKFKSPVSAPKFFSTWRCFCLDVPSHYVLFNFLKIKHGAMFPAITYYLIFENQHGDSEPRL